MQYIDIKSKILHKMNIPLYDSEGLLFIDFSTQVSASTLDQECNKF